MHHSRIVKMTHGAMVEGPKCQQLPSEPKTCCTEEHGSDLGITHNGHQQDRQVSWTNYTIRRDESMTRLIESEPRAVRNGFERDLGNVEIMLRRLGLFGLQSKRKETRLCREMALSAGRRDKTVGGRTLRSRIPPSWCWNCLPPQNC